MPSLDTFLFKSISKNHGAQKGLLEEIMLFVIKGFLPLRTIRFVWFHILVFLLCSKVVAQKFDSFHHYHVDVDNYKCAMYY